MKILILGGYGTFGGRLAHLLARDDRLTLLIAGRSVQKARDFCESLPAGAQKTALAFDRDGDVESQVSQIAPDILVDASGPFQVYGDDPYRVVKACISNSINYMDLADGSDFVKGISSFDQESRAKSIFVLSGVSSFPVLTAAVVRRLSRGIAKVISIKGGIAPSPYAGVGLNVIRAISAYAGKRIAVVRDGRRTTAHALTETMRYTICPPGYVPLENTLFSLVDVPDMQVLPELWPELETIWLGAGPVPEILHRMLIGLAWLVRLGILPTLLPFAALFHFAINILRWGPHRGGMFVSVTGISNNGKEIEQSWHLLAEKGDGPFIPSMAVEALVRRFLSGKKPGPGARPATQELELEDYETLFKDRAIYTGQRDSNADLEQAPLYKRMLGPVFEALPAPLADMHNLTTKQKTARGTARVETGNNLQARLIRALFGFPKAGAAVPVTVTFQPIDGGELWQRDFAGSKFSSFQSQGRGYFDKLLMEKFGPVTVAIALVSEQEKLKLLIRHWNILGISMPLFMAPNGETYEYVADGFFCFHVEIKHWFTGLIVQYEGRLELVD
jgi:hypothetical protein